MRRASRRGGRALLVCLALFVLTGVAGAQGNDQPTKQYLQTYSDGQTAYNDAIMRGDFSKARALFKKAIAFDDRFPGPYRYLALIAQAEKKFEECLEHAFIAVKKNPTGDNAPQVRQVHADCRKALSRPVFNDQFGDGGAIAVIARDDKGSALQGAKVKLNGLTYGATPFIRGFAVGEVEVEVELAGYLPGKATAEILMGLVSDVIVPLAVDPNATAIDKGPDVSADPEEGWIVFTVRPEGATVMIEGAPPERDEQGRIKGKPGTYNVEITAPGHEPWRRRVTFAKGQSRTIDVVLRATAERQSLRRNGYISLGVAAGLTAVGTYFGLLEMRKFEAAQDIWDTETTRPVGVDSSGVEPVRTREDIEKLRDKGKRYQIISLASFGLAAAALGTSIYFFSRERPTERAGFAWPLAVAPTLDDQGGLGAQVTYQTEIDW